MRRLLAVSKVNNETNVEIEILYNNVKTTLAKIRCSMPHFSWLMNFCFDSGILSQYNGFVMVKSWIRVSGAHKIRMRDLMIVYGFQEHGTAAVHGTIRVSLYQNINLKKVF